MDWKSIKQIYVALGATFLLGILWGYASVGGTSNCVLTRSMEGAVMQVNERTPSTAQYRVHTSSDCTLLVTTNRWPQLYVGDVIVVDGNIEPLSAIPNEYAGYIAYLDRQGIDGTARYAAITLVEQEMHRSEHIKELFTQALAAALREPEASIALAMTLGDRGGIPEDITEQFQQTGLSHIIAISGMHLSIVVGVLLFIGYLLPIPGTLRAGGVLAIVWVYVSLLSFPVSAVRSALFWSFALIAFQARSLISLGTVIVLSVVLLISIKPPIILDVGFQLSFAAVMGIGLSLFLARPYAKTFAIKILAVPLGATIATLPIVSYHFGVVSVFSVIANVVVVAVVPLFLLTVISAAFLYMLFPVIGIMFGQVAHGVWMWIAFWVKGFSGIPYAALAYTMPLWVVCVWYGVLLLICTNTMAYQGRSWREVWE